MHFGISTCGDVLVISDGFQLFTIRLTFLGQLNDGNNTTN
jgi:hypothetical protein